MLAENVENRDWEVVVGGGAPESTFGIFRILSDQPLVYARETCSGDCVK